MEVYSSTGSLECFTERQGGAERAAATEGEQVLCSATAHAPHAQRKSSLALAGSRLLSMVFAVPVQCACARCPSELKL